MAAELSEKEAKEAEVGKKHQEARGLLSSYLNKRMRISLSDGRVIIGNFLCTDRDSNIVLGSCEEFLSQDDLVDTTSKGATIFHRQPRTVGLSVVPGEHVRSLSIAKDYPAKDFHIEPIPISTSTSLGIADIAVTDLPAGTNDELMV